MEKRRRVSPNDKQILVIGYGSTLRGDDAVGRHVVELIADQSLPGVAVISATQLVPELAEQIAEAYVVIFVDACADSQGGGVEVREINNMAVVSGTPHIAAPGDLLALASACYGRQPRAWLISVPSMEFEFTEQLSPRVHNHVQSAVRAVEQLIRELNENEVAHA
jgi:hydrogenase maturation protease